MTIFNSDIRKALENKDDFKAAVLIKEQQGTRKADAKMHTWLNGPENGRHVIQEWMYLTATIPEGIKRPDLTPQADAENT